MEQVIINSREAPEWATRVNGYGYGDGYGDGDGDGYGDGYGDGDGDGDGYGDGDGDGYGYAAKAYWLSCIPCFAEKWTEAQRQRLADLQADGATIAYWRSSADGCAANGGRNRPVSPGLVETELGPLRDDCGPGQLHATHNPPRWKGERWWIVALIGDVRGDDDKVWGLKREVIGECL